MDLCHDLLPDLLPSTVAVVEAYEDIPIDPETESIYADELAAVHRAVRSRQQEFATARHCARAALVQLGHPAVPIPRGPRGAPIWPAGIVGSITHCAGYRAAAVARTTDIVALGIDAEPNDPLPPGVLDLVSLPRERAQLARLAAEPTGVAWDRLLFSAKESVYKVWFPLVGTFLDFVDAEVDIDAANHAFTARLLVEAPIVDGEPWPIISGRFTIGGDYVVTAIARESRTTW